MVLSWFCTSTSEDHRNTAEMTAWIFSVLSGLVVLHEHNFDAFEFSSG